MRSYLIILILLMPCSLQAAEELLHLPDGDVKILLFHPDSGPGPWPLCIFMPGGSGNEYVARSQLWFGKELAERGWVIAVPLSPDGRPFLGEREKLITQAITELQKSERINQGKALMAGISAGGSYAIYLAAQNPEMYLGVVAVPGRVKEQLELKDLNGLPVFMRIGENDFLGWDEQMPAMVEKLKAAGATVDADIVPDARHVFRIDWDDMGAWLDKLQNQSP